ncbi:thaumatin [Mycena pura]|uniref:Thaumatin n=1 Tax=Mycena pura TaxID=153505 RepID=A0AAD7E5R9_9AGAR|nr:thaumatin [Mycena pura]
MQKPFVAAFLLSCYGATARQFTVKNNCQYTVWCHTRSTYGVTTGPPAVSRGGAIVISASQIRPRAPPAHATAACSALRPAARRVPAPFAWGIPPVTVAEWTLGTNGQPDNYDGTELSGPLVQRTDFLLTAVSLVDGFNIPMSVVPTGGCPEASCPADLNPNCPGPLQLQGPDGIDGCKSACSANLDGNPGDSPNCCTGSHKVPATCPPSGVQDYSYFIKASKGQGGRSFAVPRWSVGAEYCLKVHGDLEQHGKSLPGMGKQNDWAETRN